MSVMFEVYYRAPADPGREADLTRLVTEFGGQLDCREEPELHGPNSVCLTYEFDDWPTAVADLRAAGLDVEVREPTGQAFIRDPSGNRIELNRVTT